MANIILEGLTTDQLTDIIRESVRDEIAYLRPHKPDPETEYLSRKEVLTLLKIDSSTLWSWEKTGYIEASGTHEQLMKSGNFYSEYWL